MNSLFNMFIEWQSPKHKEMSSKLIKFGMDKEKALSVGQGQAKFYLLLSSYKKNMNTDALTRLMEELQRDMASLANRKLVDAEFSDFFAARIGDIGRAIRYAAHKYDKTKNANPKLADASGLKKKRELDQAIENHIRKSSY